MIVEVRADGLGLVRGRSVATDEASTLAERNPEAAKQWCDVLLEVLADAGTVLDEDDNDAAAKRAVEELVRKGVLEAKEETAEEVIEEAKEEVAEKKPVEKASKAEEKVEEKSAEEVSEEAPKEAKAEEKE